MPAVVELDRVHKKFGALHVLRAFTAVAGSESGEVLRPSFSQTSANATTFCLEKLESNGGFP